MSHLPECELVEVREVMEGWLAEHPEDFETQELLIDPDYGKGIEFLRCAEGCPVLAQVIERGKELAEEHGW